MCSWKEWWRLTAPLSYHPFLTLTSLQVLQEPTERNLCCTNLLCRKLLQIIFNTTVSNIQQPKMKHYNTVVPQLDRLNCRDVSYRIRKGSSILEKKEGKILGPQDVASEKKWRPPPASILKTPHTLNGNEGWNSTDARWEWTQLTDEKGIRIYRNIKVVEGGSEGLRRDRNHDRNDPQKKKVVESNRSHKKFHEKRPQSRPKL